MKTYLLDILFIFYFICSGAGAALLLDGTFFGVSGKAHYTINEDFC